MPLHCAIVDDEEIPRSLLQALLETVPDRVQIAAVFAEPLPALQWLQQHRVDLLFLDIEMTPLSGLELAQSLLNPPLFVFSTSHPEFGVQGFELDAVDYLVKPVTLPRLLQAIQKAERRLQADTPATGALPHNNGATAEDPDCPPEDFHFFASGTESYKVDLNRLCYIEGASNYAKLHLESGEPLLIYQTLNQLAELLAGADFVRVHRSFIVNYRYVSKVERHQCWVGVQAIPLGKTYHKAFFERVGPTAKKWQGR